MSQTTKKGQVTEEAMKKFVESLAGLDPQERAVKLAEFASQNVDGVAFDPNNHQARGAMMVNLNLTDEQLDKMLEHSVRGASDAITAISNGAQLKYGMTSGDARRIGESIVETHIHKRARQTKENELSAKVFQQMLMASRGLNNTLSDEYKREAEYLGRDTYATRALTLGTDSSGGYLAPELWITQVYEALAKTGLARRLCTLVEMTTETLKLPKITGGLSAAIVGELSAATPQQGTFDQFTLTPKKLVVMTKAFSHELMVNANPAIIPILTHLATIAFGRKEDEMMFVGSDASVTGWLELTDNVTNLGGSSSSGSTAITDADFDDMADMEDALDEQYMPDEDVSNSGGVAGEARYFANKKLYNVLQKLKGNDNYYWGDVSQSRTRQIWGHPAHRVPDMPSAPAAGAAFAAFGNPKYTYFGYRPGIYVDLLKEATVDSVDMAASAGMALRLIEYVDTKVVDNDSVVVAKTAAT